MVTETIEADEALRVEIPGGRVHIDRQLPFLLLHRRPAGGGGAGTADLVLGEAAYVIAAGDEEHRGVLDRLLDTIAEAKRARFGAFLLLELWASPTGSGERGTMTFTIHAPAHGAPAVVLEELESALLGVHVDDLRARVEVAYDDDWCPVGLAPLGAQADMVHLGIEVPAVHFDPDTGGLFPFELRQLRRGLGRALKRAFYEFVHECTTTRPASYQELGRRAMTDVVREVDHELADLSDDFDLLLHVTPVNGREAEAEFLDSGARRAPEFLYRPRTVDPDRMKRRLYAIPIDEIEDPTLAHIFAEKRDELDRKLTLVTDRNTDRFLLGSRALYGDPDPDLRRLAAEVLDALEPPGGTGETGADGVERLAEAATAELDRYRQLDPSLDSVVEIRDDIPGVMVSAGNLLIGSRARVAEHRIEPLIAHEIGTHVLTYHNGLQQPFRELHGGMAGYESLQEGLGVVSEFLIGGLDGRRLRQLAGRVIAVESIIDGADFVETFVVLCREWGFGPPTAFDITMRIFRGGGFVKDVVYLRGLAQLLGYLGGGGSLERLYVGKIAHEHLHLIEELQWRSVLVAPRLLPRHLERPDVAERLERSRAGLSVLDLVEEAAR